MSSQPFPFLDLPPEIRSKIYTLAVLSPTPIYLNASYAHISFPSNLLLTNTQIYHEARPYYFMSNTFAISLLRRNETWDYILAPSFLDNIREIRSLRLNMIRWGPKDYFVEKLVPVLEDCIMNGRLREVEVRMRDRWTYGYGIVPQTEFEGAPNWAALMRVLNDPYLEYRALMAGPLGGAEVDSNLMPFRSIRWVFDFEGGVWRKAVE